MNLTIDPNRCDLETGIFVRAADAEGRYRSADISELDRTSLLTWLRSRGGENPWAEDVVGALLGHGSLHDRVAP